MSALNFGRGAFLLSAVGLLAGCAGSAVDGSMPPRDDLMAARQHHKTFRYTAGQQPFKVPNGVTTIDIIARGAAGGGEKFGRGGRVHAIVPVQPGETLFVFVGGEGTSASGGFNGGGNPGAGGGSFGGGGASDIRATGTSLSDRVLVAAGGGGQGNSSRDTFGGRGGGPTGGDGGDTYCSSGSECKGGGGGNGGHESKGGSGGAGGNGYEPGEPGAAGMLGSGGMGGTGGCYYNGKCFCGYADGCPGAGGGGGYFGGGGGGGGGGEYASIYGGPGGGGGGGSSWVEPSAIKYHTWSGWKSATGNGLVVFSWQ